MKQITEEIDFVIPWVDGGDPEWRKSKAQYEGKTDFGNGEERFRDWQLLRYWFRGVEKYAPWVRQIHFITCGHVPEWLDLSNPKLHFVKHTDYIPEEWLPTFSANPIELNLHRIEGLTEKFVYFNDDTFIIDKVTPECFFENGIPKSTAGLSIPGQVRPEFGSILLRDYGIINRNFRSRETIKKHFTKFVNFKYGAKRNLQTLLLMPYCTQFFPGFFNAHSPNAFLKSTFEEVWKKEGDALRSVCANRFRTPCDVNQYAFLWWQWCKGEIVPQDVRKVFTFFTVLTPEEKICAAIRAQKTPMIAVNDTWCDDQEKKMEALRKAFDSILGEKSSFER